MRLPQALPHLDGTRGTIAMALYIVITAGATVLLAGSVIFGAVDCFRDIPVTVSYGFRTVTVDQQAVFSTAVAPARALGARAGDRILSIDGVALPPRATEMDVGAKLARAGAAVTLVVQSAGSPARAIVLPRRGDGWWLRDPVSGLPLALQAVLEFLTPVVGPLVLLAASLLLFLRRRHDPEAILLALGFATFAGYGTNGLFWVPPSLNWLMPWILAVGAFGLPLIFVAIAGFPDGRFVSRWSRMTAVTAAFLLFSFLGVRIHNGWSVSYVPSTWLLLSNALVLLCIVLAVVTVATRLRSARGTERQQIRWAAGGFCMSLLALGLTAIIFFAGIRTYGTELTRPGFEAAGMASMVFLAVNVLQIVWSVALPLGLLVSLLRYRLYDAESAISRSVAYGALTLALLAIFAGSERVIELLGEEYFGHSIGLLAGGLGAGVAAVMIAPLHHRVSGWAERRFQKELIRLRQGLSRQLADMQETATIEELAGEILSRSEAGVHAVRGAIVQDGGVLRARGVSANEVSAWMGDWTPADGVHLDCARGDPLFPMRVPLVAEGTGAFGWLLLGPRPDGSFYGKDEREALSEIAEPIARALAVARHRTREKSRLDARLAKLEALVATLLSRRRGLAAG